MKQFFLTGLAVTLLATAAHAAPGDPVLRWNYDASLGPHGSKPTGTQIITDANSRDKDIATFPGLAPDSPWLKRNNDAGMPGKIIHGREPGAQKPVQP